MYYYYIYYRKNNLYIYRTLLRHGCVVHTPLAAAYSLIIGPSYMGDVSRIEPVGASVMWI